LFSSACGKDILPSSCNPKSSLLAFFVLRRRLPLTANHPFIDYLSPNLPTIVLPQSQGSFYPLDLLGFLVVLSYMHRRWRLLHDSGCLISQTRIHSPKDQSFSLQISNHDCDNMASFARSIKSPYLSPRMRPSVSGRTLSTSSDRSNNNSPNSPRSDDVGDFDLSGRNTPAFPQHSRQSRGRDGFFDGEDIGSRTSYFAGKLAWISWNVYPSFDP